MQTWVAGCLVLGILIYMRQCHDNSNYWKYLLICFLHLPWCTRDVSSVCYTPVVFNKCYHLLHSAENLSLMSPISLFSGLERTTVRGRGRGGCAHLKWTRTSATFRNCRASSCSEGWLLRGGWYGPEPQDQKIHAGWESYLVSLPQVLRNSCRSKSAEA